MTPRVLIAGIGNIFLGDDAFGVEVAHRLMRLSWPDNVRVADFGIRGLDLCYALMGEYQAFLLIDAAPRGGAPGDLYTLEIDLNDLGGTGEALLDGHSLDPLRVLQAVKAMGGAPERVFLIGCEPQALSGDAAVEGRMGLSPAVAEAVERAVELAGSWVTTICAQIYAAGAA